MNTRLWIVPVIGSLACHAFGQSPYVQWQVSLGGSAADQAYDIQPALDSGYVIVGVTSSSDGDVEGAHGLTDGWVVKLDPDGVLNWQVALGGSSHDILRSIQHTIDGGYILGGETSSNDGDVSGNHGGRDAWLVKLDANGGLLWQRTLGGTALDVAYNVLQDVDQGYLVIGYSMSNDGDVSGHHGTNAFTDVWLVKLDSLGAVLWQRSLGGSMNDEAFAGGRTADGHCVLVGQTISTDGDVSGGHGGLEAWLVRTDPAGVLSWQKTLGGTSTDIAHAIAGTTDGGYLIAGSTASNDGDVVGGHGGYEGWVVRLDAWGGLLWQRPLGGTGAEAFRAIHLASDGSCTVAGSATSVNGNVGGLHGFFDAWLVHLDADGDIIWQRPFGGTGLDEAYALRPTPDGGLIFVGSSGSSDGDATANHGGLDAWVVKLADPVGITEISSASFFIAPNPCDDELMLGFDHAQNDAYITMTDISGREILRERVTGSRHVLDLSQYTGGIYVLTLSTQVGTHSKRLVVQ